MENTSQLIAELARQMLRGFNWGLAARTQEIPLRKPEEISQLAQSLSKEGETAVMELFTKFPANADIIAKADLVVDTWSALEDLREYLIDLCLLRIIVEGGEQEGESFLDGAAWEKVEQVTEDRGTEMLNLLVYLRDCGENETEPSLDDFLNEFLLVSDEDFQEELGIYEEFIRSRDIIDGSLQQLIQAGNAIRDPEMQEIYTPTMLFFKSRELKPGNLMLHLLNESRSPELHAALYLLMTGFYISDGQANFN
ncbi:MAG TPA: hypothetical protein ENJ82_10020 [Bacteroidetes bacterium]|nr:hypothetical protein [Bacteroidota bacterium]